MGHRHITLFSDYEKLGCSKPRSVAIVCFTHALVDARSVVQKLQNMKPKSEKSYETSKDNGPAFSKKIRNFLKTGLNFILSPYQLVVRVYEGSDWNLECFYVQGKSGF